MSSANGKWYLSYDAISHNLVQSCSLPNFIVDNAPTGAPARESLQKVKLYHSSYCHREHHRALYREKGQRLDELDNHQEYFRALGDVVKGNTLHRILRSA